tara:strand:- start:28096 stop:28536 length:441 start_codon:yes stop_codon:yes gene_type:complete
MEPNKSIPSFCFESPWLKPFSFEMSSVEVTAGERRIRATWTPELTQDLESYHNIDAEAELTRMLSEQLTQEIDREIVENIRDNWTIAQDLIPAQPMDAPQGRLMYFDYPLPNLETPIVYTDGSWSMSNTFDGVIGIKSEIKPHTLI